MSAGAVVSGSWRRVGETEHVHEMRGAEQPRELLLLGVVGIGPHFHGRREGQVQHVDVAVPELVLRHRQDHPLALLERHSLDGEHVEVLVRLRARDLGPHIRRLIGALVLRPEPLVLPGLRPAP